MANTRKTASADHMVAALAALIKENGFAGVTVAAIVRRAHVNRGTFYLHYQDKYDMLQKVESQLFTRYRRIVAEHTATSADNGVIADDLILHFLEALRSDIDVVSALLLADADAHFMANAQALLKDLLHLDQQPASADLPPQYAQAVVMASTLAVLRLWIEEGARSEPAVILRYINIARGQAPVSLANGLAG
ncbi:TetR/AcrR family transcriptional regulator [Lacticaseibacillus sharpeae]|uniref:HTH tetR-type domain-containing protein n=1 Tax=Lacticaseibacillus sharpeae JCM 1186 = DSM 20505 TaxID=1291052 RepID=A0A0R1ZKG6_9LACO|nr:TetR/AcrR family transcriptional regulator [Lacticaseibacillus sharpeae]KRM55464.1 hypothetical protein FC18_GL001360 [Lacticaseibacillus sharpeae JCM 1186 = DSM 20505]